jgi:hypothetical protein
MSTKSNLKQGMSRSLQDLSNRNKTQSGEGRKRKRSNKSTTVSKKKNFVKG